MRTARGISPLKAADALCEAARSVDWTNIEAMLDHFKANLEYWPHADSQLRNAMPLIRKAINDFEEAK